MDARLACHRWPKAHFHSSGDLSLDTACRAILITTVMVIRCEMDREWECGAKRRIGSSKTDLEFARLLSPNEEDPTW